MPRKPTPPMDIVAEAPIVTAGLAELGAEHSLVQANVTALADQLGYDGSLTIGALEDEIRFYQRRSVEAMLAVGTRLLLLREMTPHGQFISRIELLGFSSRTAQRFMQAALKTSKSANLALLSGQVTEAGKFLELVTLDDDDLEALAEGGTVAGLTLSEYDKMSASEMRATLKARDKVMADQAKKINDLATQIEKTPKKAIHAVDMWNAQLMRATDEIGRLGTVGDEILGKHVAFIDLCESLTDKLDPEAADYRDKLEQARVPIARVGDQIERFAHVVARLRFEFENRVGGYLDKSHILSSTDAE